MGLRLKAASEVGAASGSGKEVTGEGGEGKGGGRGGREGGEERGGGGKKRARLTTGPFGETAAINRVSIINL
jgi:hypothetical protein